VLAIAACSGLGLAWSTVTPSDSGRRGECRLRRGQSPTRKLNDVALEDGRAASTLAQPRRRRCCNPRSTNVPPLRPGITVRARLLGNAGAGLIIRPAVSPADGWRRESSSSYGESTTVERPAGLVRADGGGDPADRNGRHRSARGRANRGQAGLP